MYGDKVTLSVSKVKLEGHFHTWLSCSVKTFVMPVAYCIGHWVACVGEAW